MSHYLQTRKFGILCLVIIFCLILAVVWNKNRVYGQVTPPVSQNLRILAFGDSLVVGVGSTPGNDFVSVLSRRIGVPIINAGTSGLTTAQAINVLDTQVINLNPNIVIIVLGGNDILQAVPLTQRISNLRIIIQRIQTSGAQVILAAEQGPLFETSTEVAYANLASETGAHYVTNVLDGIAGNPINLSDAVHPNDRGYQIMADRIFPVLQSTINSLPAQDLTVTCSPSRTTSSINSNVTWTAFVTGGAGNYRYVWSGTDNLQGTNSTTNISYSSAGVKSASATVTSGTVTITQQCADSVSIVNPPLTGSCSVSANSTPTGYNLVFTSLVSNTATTTTFSWTGTDGLAANTQSITQAYTTTGEKTATLTAHSGNQTLTLLCSASIDPQIIATTTRTWNAGCSSSNYGLSITWNSFAFTGQNTYNYSWTGTDGLSSATANFQKLYTTPGTKSATVQISGNGQVHNFTCQTAISDLPPSNNTNGCFIATAAFGTELDPHVITLRNFRDKELLTTKLGTEFVQTYYKYSPPIANYISQREDLKAIVRAGLWPIIFVVENFSDSSE